MVTILEIPYREASRTGIFFGFDENLEQTAINIIARLGNTQKCHFVDYKQPRFATRFLEAITDSHFYRSLSGHSNIKKLFYTHEEWRNELV